MIEVVSGLDQMPPFLSADTVFCRFTNASPYGMLIAGKGGVLWI